MIDDPRGAIDFDEQGSGPPLVLVPGSFSTGAAWRPMVRALTGRWRTVTTSLLGYGGTAERRSLDDLSIDSAVEALDAVLQRVGAPAHVVGHSYGGQVALAWALRNPLVPLSLTLIEPPCCGLLEVGNERAALAQFHAMSDPYIAAWRGGEVDAARRMIDFYGGVGCYDAMPERAQAFIRQTTQSNVLDWLVAYRDQPAREALSHMRAPTQVLRGALGNSAVHCSNALISQWLPNASLLTVPGASHFMISTHADDVARLIELHIATVSKGAPP